MTRAQVAMKAGQTTFKDHESSKSDRRTEKLINIFFKHLTSFAPLLSILHSSHMRTYKVILRFIKSYSSQQKHKRPVKSHLALVSALLSVLSVPNLLSLSLVLQLFWPAQVSWARSHFKFDQLNSCVWKDWLSFTRVTETELLAKRSLRCYGDSRDHLWEKLTCETFLLVERPA